MKNFLTRLSLTAVLLGMVAPAYSASISFKPTGSQIDSDPINDLVVQVGQQFTFTLGIDTTGLANTLQSFTYVVTRDNTEILLDSAALTPAADALFDRTVISDIVTPPFTVGTIELGGGLGLVPNSQLDFGTATYTVQPGLVNDGVFDYKVELISAFDDQGNDITSLFEPASQELEVQSPEPSSILSLLALGALGAGSIFKKKQS
ncbi:hypothetical protein C7H19_11675 [Aphanothece hegewaldii CCALA 016]|uniref:PEP-CTERM sorting domain-containing protein n=1 Tax=Aphanothece hegewaldii CCALA 016 TaxID=2107694 RepID=A0A2T1LXI0_9CHRO|nr:PEP-CTERM sorting domain-containing protein [Aphanothece hegewaldii]PSF37092.1 hypothetical protein C7H19_11675 [Aphanothece hegewaldii CCALA 016]